MPSIPQNGREASMSLIRVVSNEFDSDVRSRGRKYFDKGLVDILQTDAGQIDAQVQGTELYDVRIEWTDDRFRGSCSCPFAEDRGPCKHLWATLLAADEAGLLPDDQLKTEAPTGFGMAGELLNALLGTRLRSVKSKVRSNP